MPNTSAFYSVFDEQDAAMFGLDSRIDPDAEICSALPCSYSWDDLAYARSKFDITGRLFNIFWAHEIRTPRQLSAMTRHRFSMLRNVGRLTIQDAERLLARAGLTFADEETNR